MSDIAKSPDRHTFQRNNYVRRMTEQGRLDDPHVQRMIKFYTDWAARAAEQEQDPAWQENNLEWDLRTTDWVIEKCRSDVYAQNLYAALCNMQWQKREVIPILKDEYWSCSWRSAGGIVADIQGKGDYIDWYCSGIRDTSWDEEENAASYTKGYVPEGTVTEEIENDMYVLGWMPVPYAEDDKP
jgi:hypothetical protein